MAVKYHKRTFACRVMNTVVMCEFSKWEPVTPVGLSVVDENSEILLDLLVDLFRLPIGLQVEHGRGVWHDIQHLVQFLHELGDELWTSV